MTTIEAGIELAVEHELSDSEFARLISSYDGYTPTERNLSPELVEATRNARQFDPKTLAAAMFQVSDVVKLHFYFDLHEVQIAFGD